MAFTVVAAPTVTWTVFNGLSGQDPRPPYEVAYDYVVTTFWHRDLGTWSTVGDPVGAFILHTLPVDLAMVLGGVTVGVVFGTLGGVVVASRPGSAPARLVNGSAAVVLSSPPYWLGFMILIFFAPGTGYVLEIPFVSGLMDYVPLTQDPLGWLKAMWMPWVLVGLPLAAAVLRMTASTLRDVAGEEFLRTARAKGLRERTVMRRHALPLAVAPVAALTGANMAMLITNIALMESAFNLPGLYREIRTVYSHADLTLIQAMIIETTVVISVVNLLADIVQARVDPRTR